MNKSLMPAALIVAGMFVSHAAQADEGHDGFICHWVDLWFGDVPVLCPTPQYPEFLTRGVEAANDNESDPRCLGCGGIPGAPRDIDPPNRGAEVVGGNDVDPVCLGCGGLATRPDGEADREEMPVGLTP